MIVAIIGAGASGMAAALAASENPETQVLLLERQARVGRKLQATGNGRCNLTNLHAAAQGYHGQEPTFSRFALDSYGPEETLAWFSQLGLYAVAEASGRVYPYSEQANSVVDVLRFALERPNIQLKLGFEVKKVRKAQGGFTLEGPEESLFCQKLIVACGGLAGTKLGGTMSGYQILRSLGHRCTRLRPALVQLQSTWGALPGLKGVRAQCRATICRDGQSFAQSRGELQFTQQGLSGPVIFEISRDACQGGGAWECRLDFLPDMEVEELKNRLLARQATSLPASELFTGILHNRLGRVLTQGAGISPSRPISEVSQREIEALCALVKDFSVPLTEPMGMDCAQVTAGGIQTQDFDSRTLESRLVPGLYACGEVLDVDGDCGGYNLQWAWSSGRLAGSQAGRSTI